MFKRFKVSLLVAIALLLTVATIGSPARAQDTKLTPVRLQLKWVAQAQFAGYYIALEKGYYKQVGLDVTIIPGGPDITPLQVLASGGAEFALAWMPDGLAARDKGADPVNIAQVYTRSGMRHISWKDSNLKAVKDFKGKKVGVWCCGNQYELYAALVKNGMSPDNADDLTIVNQPFDMNLFLNREIDAAAAMTYNELAQVLETINPKTGKLYTLDDLNVIDFADEGTDMLQDSVYASEAWLAKAGNEDIAVKFLAASFAGWASARDDLPGAVEIVLKNGTTLGKGHQTWQMNEVSKLIWPAPKGVGLMDEAAFKRTAEISLKYKVISKEPDKGAYRTDLTEKAHKLVTADPFKVEIIGDKWKAVTVEITEGGK
jgi:NitT/TauT family transport system substrate-binding protein